MIRPDFQNYMPEYGGGNKLVTEFIRLTQYVKMYPNSAAVLLAKFSTDSAAVEAALRAALVEQATVTVTGSGEVTIGSDLTLTIAVDPASFEYTADDVGVTFDPTIFDLKSKSKTSVVLTAKLGSAGTSVVVSVKGITAPAYETTVDVTD